MSRRALVRLAGQRVGELSETADGYIFTYAPEWVSRIGSQSVSLNLAVRAEPYVSRHLHPCFANLLPEGWLLELSVAKLKIPGKTAKSSAVLDSCRWRLVFAQIGWLALVSGEGPGPAGSQLMDKRKQRPRQAELPDDRT